MEENILDLDKCMNYHVFLLNNKYYLFDIIKMECVEIDRIIYEYLCGNKNLEEQRINSILEYLKSTEYFFGNNKVELNNDKFNKVSFSLTPITQCNLRCKYCFAEYGQNNKSKKKVFTDECLKGIVHFLIRNFPNIDRFRLDFVSGGEPLLDPSRLEKTLEIITTEFNEYKKILEIFLCTNGTLINDNVCEILSKYNINLGISMDGDSEIHNRNRIYANGIGTYEDIYCNIKQIQDNSEKYASKLQSIWGLAVITTETSSLLEIINHHMRVGFSNIQMKLVRLSKDKKLAFSQENIHLLYKLIDELVDFFYNNIAIGRVDKILFWVNENDYFGKIIKRLLLKEVYGYRCYAGKAKFAFTPEGEIYPCDSFVGNKEFCLGNIREGFNEKSKDVFWNINVDNREKCSVCWCRYICAGDCLHNAYCTNGNIYESDEVFCMGMKYAIENFLCVINILENVNKDALDELRHILSVRKRIN